MIGAAEEALGPVVHLAGDLLCDLEKDRVVGDGELEVADVVQRHGGDLTEGVLAVEHPTVGARQQGVGDVAQARFQWRVGLGGRPGSLDPLTLEIVRDLGSVKIPGAGVGDRDVGAGNGALGVEEGDGLALGEALRPSATRVWP